MLYALSIRSFVLIDRLDLEATTGFTALTGETGAGKSIILDALGLVLGGAADRSQVRHGAEQASVSAEFSVDADHPAWEVLQTHGIEPAADEGICLRRTISTTGPSRAFVNGQPVAAAVLSALGETLVEIHGQHAASGLMRPASHLDLLDSFAGLEDEARICADLWLAFEDQKAVHADLAATVRAARERFDWLSFAVEELSKLAPESGEVETLTAQRSVLLQSERICEAIDEAAVGLSDTRHEEVLANASRAVERIVRIPELEALEGDLPAVATAAAEAIERALIEVAEAQQAMRDLSRFSGHDPHQLETVEARLFALRAAARKYDCLPELLPETLTAYQDQLALCEADTDAMTKAEQALERAETAWRKQAERLSEARRAEADRLEAAVMTELEPLHLGRVKLQVRFTEIGSDDSGHKGLERAEFEVETNPGAGFGPLKAIASGGELARFSLALKCALSQSGDSGTLIFDEADQGVGGAVAAAIGERLASLADERQVFAITHSPQVASAANRQWRILKEALEDDHMVSRVSQLDDGQRLEEIARMLSGSSITNEARAAALKLLEAA